MDYDLKETLVRLNELYDKWLLSRNMRDRSNAKDSIIRIINNRHYIPDEIYTEANNGWASGLCQPGFFEEDIRKLISILETKLNH